jgi:hypothetical protein
MKKLAFAFLALSTTANAQSYKCIVSNITSYQAQPCEAGREEIIKIDMPPPKHDSVNELNENDDGLIIGKLDIKMGEKLHDKKHIYFYPRVQVTNNTEEPQKMYLRYQGLDSEGFEIDWFQLSGTINPHSSKYLTEEKGKEIVKLKKVIKWELQK